MPEPKEMSHSVCKGMHRRCARYFSAGSRPNVSAMQARVRRVALVLTAVAGGQVVAGTLAAIGAGDEDGHLETPMTLR